VAAKTLAGRRIQALEAALADATDYISRDIRCVIDSGTVDYDLTTASKGTRACIDESNELLGRLYTVLTGKADPAGICKFCRCTPDNACVLPDGEPCAWFTENVCTNPACMKASEVPRKNHHRKEP
jgi:hypothetical protein